MVKASHVDLPLRAHRRTLTEAGFLFPAGRAQPVMGRGRGTGTGLLLGGADFPPQPTLAPGLPITGLSFFGNRVAI